jgi:hypothetical protein
VQKEVLKSGKLISHETITESKAGKPKALEVDKEIVSIQPETDCWTYE